MKRSKKRRQLGSKPKKLAVVKSPRVTVSLPIGLYQRVVESVSECEKSAGSASAFIAGLVRDYYLTMGDASAAEINVGVRGRPKLAPDLDSGITVETKALLYKSRA